MEPERDFRLTVESAVAPSEDEAKVETAMMNVVGECATTVSRGRGSLRLVTRDPRCLARIRDQLRDRRVRAAARRLLLAGTRGRKATVMLNRQAAAVGVIALCSSEEESPLGPLYLTIESGRLDRLVEELTSYEQRGKR